MELVRAVVFDLDDTLYLERDYVASGFRAVAAELARITSLQQDELFAFLWDSFQAGARGDNFDRLRREYSQVASAIGIDGLVSHYRRHWPQIELFGGVSHLLGLLDNSHIGTGIITDGPVSSQTAKIDALGLASRVRHVVQTDAWGVEYRKPHARAYEYISFCLGVAPAQCVYVGDNAVKDFCGAKALGWKTIRLRIPAQLRYMIDAADAEHAADVEVGSISQLSSLLCDYCGL